MGHQVNFYLDSEDTNALEQRLKSIEPFLVLHSRSPSATPLVLDSLNATENGKPWLFFYLVRPDDLKEVVCSHVPAQGYWSVDCLRSPAIEFTRCYKDSKIIRRGRIYFVDGFFDSDAVWQEKPDDFRAWAKKILTTTKRSLKKRGPEYIGTGAEAWEASGRELVM